MPNPLPTFELQASQFEITLRRAAISTPSVTWRNPNYPDGTAKPTIRVQRAVSGSNAITRWIINLSEPFRYIRPSDINVNSVNWSSPVLAVDYIYRVKITNPSNKAGTINLTLDANATRSIEDLITGPEFPQESGSYAFDTRIPPEFTIPEKLYTQDTTTNPPTFTELTLTNGLLLKKTVVWIRITSDRTFTDSSLTASDFIFSGGCFDERDSSFVKTANTQTTPTSPQNGITVVNEWHIRLNLPNDVRSSFSVILPADSVSERNQSVSRTFEYDNRLSRPFPSAVFSLPGGVNRGNVSEIGVNFGERVTNLTRSDFRVIELPGAIRSNGTRTSSETVLQSADVKLKAQEFEMTLSTAISSTPTIRLGGLSSPSPTIVASGTRKSDSNEDTSGPVNKWIFRLNVPYTESISSVNLTVTNTANNRQVTVSSNPIFIDWNYILEITNPGATGTPASVTTNLASRGSINATLSSSSVIAVDDRLYGPEYPQVSGSYVYDTRTKVEFRIDDLYPDNDLDSAAIVFDEDNPALDQTPVWVEISSAQSPTGFTKSDISISGACATDNPETFSSRPKNSRNVWRLEISILPESAGIITVFIPSNVVEEGNDPVSKTFEYNTSTAVIATATWTNVIGGGTLSGTLTFNRSGITGLGDSDLTVLNASGSEQTGWRLENSPPDELKIGQSTRITMLPPTALDTDADYKLRINEESVRSDNSDILNSPEDHVDSAAARVNTRATWQSVEGGTRIIGNIIFNSLGVSGLGLDTSTTPNTSEDFEVITIQNGSTTDWIITHQTGSVNAGTLLPVTANPPTPDSTDSSTYTHGYFKLRLKSGSVTRGARTFPSLPIASDPVYVDNRPTQIQTTIIPIFGRVIFEGGTTPQALFYLYWSGATVDQLNTFAVNYRFSVANLRHNATLVNPSITIRQQDPDNTFRQKTVIPTSTIRSNNNHVASGSNAFQITVRTLPSNTLGTIYLNVPANAISGSSYGVSSPLIYNTILPTANWTEITGGESLSGKITFSNAPAFGIDKSDFAVLRKRSNSSFTVDSSLSITGISATSVSPDQFVEVTTNLLSVKAEGHFKLRLKANTIKSLNSGSDNAPTIDEDSDPIYVNNAIIWENVRGGSRLTGDLKFEGQNISGISADDFEVRKGSGGELDDDQNWNDITIDNTSGTISSGNSVSITAVPPSNITGSFLLRLKEGSVLRGGASSPSTPVDSGSRCVDSTTAQITPTPTISGGIFCPTDKEIHFTIYWIGATNTELDEDTDDDGLPDWADDDNITKEPDAVSAATIEVGTREGNSFPVTVSDLPDNATGHLTITVEAEAIRNSPAAESPCAYYDTRPEAAVGTPPSASFIVPGGVEKGITSLIQVDFEENGTPVDVFGLTSSDFTMTGSLSSDDSGNLIQPTIVLLSEDIEIELGTAVNNLQSSSVSLTGGTTVSSTKRSPRGPSTGASEQWIIQLSESSALLTQSQITVTGNLISGSPIFLGSDYVLRVTNPTNSRGTLNAVLARNAVTSVTDGVSGPIVPQSSGSYAFDTRTTTKTDFSIDGVYPDINLSSTEIIVNNENPISQTTIWVEISIPGTQTATGFTKSDIWVSGACTTGNPSLDEDSVFVSDGEFISKTKGSKKVWRIEISIPSNEKGILTVSIPPDVVEEKNDPVSESFPFNRLESVSAAPYLEITNLPTYTITGNSITLTVKSYVDGTETNIDGLTASDFIVVASTGSITPTLIGGGAS